MTDRPSARHPFARPRRRGADAVQFGADGHRTTVVSGLTDQEARTIVDTGAARAGLLTSAGLDLGSPRWHQVSALLDEATTRDGPEAAQAHAATVIVSGTGAVPDTICACLRQIATDVASGEESIARCEQDLADRAGHRPDLVVLPCRDGISPHAYGPWQRHGIPHLPVVVLDHEMRVGPLVRPGAPGPCLRCLDLHRADRDPLWPDIAAQLDSTWPLPAAITTYPELSATASGLVALVTRGLLSGHPLPAGLCFSITTPQPRVRHHAWSAHPACDCWRDTLIRPEEAEARQ